ncbi:MAG: DUF2147 domain-containing protein [Flavobacteriales bacterium]
MKSFILTSVILIAFGFSSIAQSDAIIGEWYNQEKDAVINITKSENNTFQGQIVWMLNPNDENGNPKTDPLNPEEELRSRSRMGMTIMYNFQFDGENVWDEGEIYDPKSGNTYSGTMTLTSENKLDLRGYVGLPIFGRTSNWSRKLD